jgi:anti-sigma factor RsiW
MDCKHALPLLEAYLDKELDRAEARELEHHVDGCADCRAALTRLDGLRVALRDRSLRYVAPPALRERIASARTPRTDVAEPPGAPGVAAQRRRGPASPALWRMAAACVLAFGAGGMFVHLWNPGKGDAESAQVARDLFASHWRALAAASPVDVVSTDRHTVKPWFAGKLAVAPPVQDFAERGFALVGGRLDYIGSERVAVLVYRHGQHLIDVFVLPSAESNAVNEPTQQQGYTLSTVKLGSQRAAIVSDMDAREMALFAQVLETSK